jgi:PAS domain S-box-containing protein
VTRIARLPVLGDGVLGRSLVGYLVLQLACGVLFFGGPSETVRAVGLVAAPVLAGAAVTLAACRHRLVRAPAWLALAAGVVLSGAGWGWMSLAPLWIDGVDPSGVGGNALFVLAYLVSAAGLVALVGLRRRGDRVAVLDAGMLGVGLGLLVWVLVEPSAPAAGVSGEVRSALLTYLLIDVLLVAVAARVLFAGPRNPRIWLLALWVVAQAVGDTVYAVQVLHGSFRFDGPLFALWLAGYAAVGAAALLPDRQVRRRFGGWHRAVGPVAVAVAVVPLPVLLLVRAAQGVAHHVLLIATGSVVITVLALLRGLVARDSSSAAARAAVRWSAARFAAGFLVLALLPLAGLAYVAVHQSEAAMRTEVRDRMEVTASVSAQYVREQLRSLETLVSSYADRPALVAALQAPGGPDIAAVELHMQSLHAAYPQLSAAWVLDPEGDMLAIRPAAKSVMTRNFAYRGYFRGALDRDGAYVSEAYTRSAPPHERVISASRAVRTSNGRVVGVVSIGYRLGAITAFSKRLADVQGVRLTITDQAGHLLAGAGSETAGLPVAEDRRVTTALAGRSGTVEGPGEDGPSVSAFRPVEGSGWAVVAEVSDDVAFAGQRRQSAQVIAAAVLLGQMLLVGMILAVRAHNRRREAEAVLSEREEHLRGVLEAAGDAYVSVDADGRVNGWNDAATTVFGHDRETALGADLADLVIPPEARPAQRSHSDLVRVVVDGREPQPGRRFEVEAMHADGHRFPAEVTLWQSSTSGARSLNAFIRDVSERTRQQKEVAEARDAALEASRLKSEFVANMSHEVRTPMNGVLGMTSLLRSTSLDPVQRDYADTIASSAEALLTVIDDILNFSKIEAGRLEIEAVDFEVRRLVEEVSALMAPAAHGRETELVVHVDQGVPAAVCGDPHRLRQVLTNLVGNAVKYTERGEVVVSVEPGELDPSHVRIAVQDTGIGISPDQQGRLFEAFQQADASTTRRYGGTGLGLTISRQLVELMGGSLQVQSELGCGSTFFFELPLPAATSLPAARPVPSDLAGTRILVVDDNATNRKVLQQLLTSWSLRPTCAADPRGALVELHEAARDGRPYGLVLLDMHMPGKDGLELAAEVRADADLATTPLVMLTSSSEGPERTWAKSAGVDAYLVKPVREVPLYECQLDLLTECGRETPDTGLRAPAAAVGRVLVAEDNVVNQKVAIGMLTSLGYTVDVADDGRQAVDMAARGGYDVVLMDCQMPRLDGFAATQQIRASGPAAGVPIIAVTASALETDRERCRAAGMDDFLSKPLHPDTLAATLTRWVGSGARNAVPAEAAVEQLAGEEEVLDPDLMARLVQLGPQLLGNLVATFTETAAARIDGLEAAVLAGHMDEVARITHSLKGSSGALAARRLSRLAAEAEETAMDGQPVPMALLSDIRGEYGRAVKALTAAARHHHTEGTGTP